MSMDNYAYMRRKRYLEMTDKEMSEARKNAIQNMIYFRNDNPLYIIAIQQINQKKYFKHKRSKPYETVSIWCNKR